MGAVPQCPSSNNMKCQLIFLVAFFLPISSLGQTTMPSTPDPTGLTSTDADTTDSQTTTTTTTTTTTESNNNNGGGDGWFVVPGAGAAAVSSPTQLIALLSFSALILILP